MLFTCAPVQALCARHIGGAINFVAVAAVTGIDGVMVSAALAADNLICALYFTSLYALARNIPADQAGQKQGASGDSVKEVLFSRGNASNALSL